MPTHLKSKETKKKQYTLSQTTVTMFLAIVYLINDSEPLLEFVGVLFKEQLLYVVLFHGKRYGMTSQQFTDLIPFLPDFTPPSVQTLENFNCLCVFLKTA